MPTEKFKSKLFSAFFLTCTTLPAFTSQVGVAIPASRALGNTSAARGEDRQTCSFAQGQIFFVSSLTTKGRQGWLICLGKDCRNGDGLKLHEFLTTPAERIQAHPSNSR